MSLLSPQLDGGWPQRHGQEFPSGPCINCSAADTDNLILKNSDEKQIIYLGVPSQICMKHFYSYDF